MVFKGIPVLVLGLEIGLRSLVRNHTSTHYGTLQEIVMYPGQDVNENLPIFRSFYGLDSQRKKRLRPKTLTCYIFI